MLRPPPPPPPPAINDDWFLTSYNTCLHSSTSTEKKRQQQQQQKEKKKHVEKKDNSRRWSRWKNIFPELVRGEFYSSIQTKKAGNNLPPKTLRIVKCSFYIMQRTNCVPAYWWQLCDWKKERRPGSVIDHRFQCTKREQLKKEVDFQKFKCFLNYFCWGPISRGIVPLKV